MHYDLVSIKRDEIGGIRYVAVNYRTSPYNYEDYPEHKQVTLHRFHYFEDSSLLVYSARLNLEKTELEWVDDHEREDFRDCISIGVW